MNRSLGISVAVNRTHGGGPLAVDTRSNLTGDPVNATVFVDGDRVGTTGTDGRFWTVAPREAYTVAVATEDRQNVTVGPLFPERTT